ncbi:MAG: signal peptidase I [Planctomycetota bacterium]
MAKKKQRGAKTPDRPPLPPSRDQKAGKTDAGNQPQKHPSARFGRETADALVIAFAMAFLIRTFQAEQFVIPTGSMAPTLMGAHHDVDCRECGQRYRINGSTLDSTVQAVTRDLGPSGRRSAQGRQAIAGAAVVAGVCPSCRYLMPIDEDGLERYTPPGDAPPGDYLRYPGDRLVVNKYAYSFRDPERWDVVVFKYPGNATRNYIKRLVGLPGEELRVLHGDLYTRPTGSVDEFVIARKPPKTLLAMRQLVHDTDRDPADLYEASWPLRWAGDDAWTTETAIDEGHAEQTYNSKPTDNATHWLRYTHTPAPETFWKITRAKTEQEIAFEAQPSLITDFTPYNVEISRRDVLRREAFSLNPVVARGGFDASVLGKIGVHWVGDLMVEADVSARSASGTLLLELVEHGTHYTAAIDLATGEATLGRRAFEGDDRETLASGPTSVRGSGEWRLGLSNFDEQLTLWIDGHATDLRAPYDDGVGLTQRQQRLPETSDDDPGDLAPAAVGVEGADITIDRLQLWRDTYYVADSDKTTLAGTGLVLDYPVRRWIREQDAANRREILSASVPGGIDGVEDNRPWPLVVLTLPGQPDDWPLLAQRKHVDFPLGEDQLFVMGDNSGHSSDARLWAGRSPEPGKPGGAYLERKQLIGKATWVYWPRAWYTLPTGINGIRIPIVPNFADMRLVR